MCACGMDETAYHVNVKRESHLQERSELMQVVRRELGEEMFINWNDNEVEGMCFTTYCRKCKLQSDGFNEKGLSE